MRQTNWERVARAAATAWTVLTALTSACSATSRGEDASFDASSSVAPLPDVATPTDADAEPAWTSLLNGSSLTGWIALPGGTWEVRAGVLVGTSLETEPRHALLVSEQSFSDFRLRLSYRLLRGNSGIYFRSELSGDNFGVSGVQVEADNTNEAGGVDDTVRAWLARVSGASPNRPGEWNSVELSAIGSRVTVTFNGVVTADFEDSLVRRSGRIALQLHGGYDMHVEYKDLEVQVLHAR